MLILGSRIANTAVMSLQTGTRIGRAVRPIIDPGTLKIFAYEVDGPLLDEHPSFLRTIDVREMGPVGMIVDSSDEFIGLNDVIKLKELHELNFPLIGMSVIDDTRHKLGKVEDYTLETGDFVIQQMSIKRGIIRGITDTSLLVHRSQIVEINDKYIVVKSATKEKRAEAPKPVILDYVNPFRDKQTPQPEPTKTN
jgi:sporulation protein YlmC with PRC-barrel domain